MSIYKCPIILFSVCILLLFSCQQPFDLTTILDGESGKSLSIEPSSAIVTINESITLTAAGGVPPYTFSIEKGNGTIESDTGVYTAPSQPGTDIIKVVDSYANSSMATIVIKSSSDEDGTAGLVDYVVTHVTSDLLSVDRNSTVTEQFDIKNNGTGAGSEPVDWQAYVSTDTVYSTGDTFIASGTSDALAAGESRTGIAIGGTWPYEGDYYLIVRISADDETKSGWDSGYSGPFSVINTPDYSITSVTLPIIDYGGNPGEKINLASGGASQQFVIHNDANGGNGGDPINWTAYLSADTTIDGGDTVLGSDTIAGGLPTNGDSAAQSFGDDDTLPATAGIYYILITISAGDDYNTSNNTYTSVHVLVWDTTNSETDTSQDDTIATAEDYHVILNTGDTLTVAGTLDDAYSDFFLLRTGPATTSLDIQTTWNTSPAKDLIDMYLFESGGSQVSSSTDGSLGVEPSSGTWTVSNPDISSNSTYYLEIRINDGSGVGEGYELTVTGN